MKASMTTSKYIRQILLYRPWLFTFNVLAWAIIHLLPVVFGLIIREFFNHLEGAKTFNLDLILIMLALLGMEAFRLSVL
jgi:ATP-binding cassette, subfamily B, bacterial